MLRSDEEIIALCSVNLLFIDETTYGIIRKIRAPNPAEIEQKTPPAGTTRKKPTKKTCLDNMRNKAVRKTEQKPKRTSVREKRLRTLSESHQVTFGIEAPPTVTRSVRCNRQNIDYLTLNNGLEDDEISSPKRKKRATHRPGSGPSVTHQAARKHTASLEPKSVPKSGTATSSPAVSTSTNKTNTDLTGILNVLDDQILPDLVLEQEDPDTSQAMGTVSLGLTMCKVKFWSCKVEEMDAAATVLSLGEVRDDTLDSGDNADLMPIGGQNIAIDAAPKPIRLDQVSVDKAIAGLIQSENQDKDKTTNDKPDQQIEHPTGSTTFDNAEKHKPDQSTGDHDESEPVTKGTLKTRTYALKKKIQTKKRSFKCSECNVVKKTIKELNIHHRECHNPQICGVCGKLFKLASSLAWHMYEHNKPKYKCDQCDHMCQFESELQTHKIVHRKNPSHQCMKANCGKWFMRK